MDEQFQPQSVTAEKLDRWEQLAKLEAERLPVAGVNWTMIVLSLIEEVRRRAPVS